MKTSLFFAALGGAAPIDTAPIDTIRSLDARLAAMYNAQNFSGVASLYNPGAEIIPPTGNTFIKGSDAAAFFKDGYDSGVTDLKLTPLTVQAESPTLYHEIGNVTHALQPGGGLYYVRWFLAGGAWQVALDAMAMGLALDPSHAPVTPQPPTAAARTVQAMEDKWSAAYNAGDFGGVAALYNPGAQLIAPESSAFLAQPGLAAFFKAGAAAGITGVKLSTANVHQESATLIHEIGTVASDAGGATYYVRWIKPSDAAPWQIAFDIMSIGE